MKNKLLKLALAALLTSGLIHAVTAAPPTAAHREGGGKSIYVAGCDDFYPIEYYNSDTDSYEGVMPELLDVISECTGIEFTYIHGASRSAAELAQNAQVELVSAYIDDSDDAWVMDSVTVFTYTLNGEAAEIGFAFTEIADAELVDAIKTAADGITDAEIYGLFIENSAVRTTNHLMLIIAVCICLALLITAIVLLIMHIRQLKKQSLENKMTDAETGIGNLAYFKYHFENTVSDASRPLYYVAYLTIDSGFLKTYHGEATFDDVVNYTASVLVSWVRDNEFAARITENGFALTFQCPNRDDAARQIRAVIRKLFKYIDGREHSTKPIYHAALYGLTASDRNSELLLFNLRKCCSKIWGTAEQLVICDANMMNSDGEEAMLLSRFMRGFNNEEFKLYLQFIVDNKEKRIVSAEALSRWDDPERGLLYPGSYIKDMEEAGLIDKLDLYMLERVCRQLESWSQTEYSSLSIACNFTRITISEVNFLERFRQIVSKYSFDYARLIIEITEDVIEKSREIAMSNISECKRMGFTIALDDLGSGYTSLINLCDYPIDIVKIDRDILLKADKKKGRELFSGMIALAHSLNLKIVCEGVETAEQDALVTSSDCDYIQGWYYSRVFPIAEGERFANKYFTK